MTAGLTDLLERLSSWVTATDSHGLSNDALPDVITLEQRRELWEKERSSVRVALAIVTNEPAPRLTSTRPRSLNRWLMNLVHFS
jgi:hypothetical protein